MNVEIDRDQQLDVAGWHEGETQARMPALMRNLTGLAFVGPNVTAAGWLLPQRLTNGMRSAEG